MADQDEISKVRERMHKLADMVQVHERQLAQHDVMISAHTTTLEALRQQMSTRQQLESAVRLLEVGIENATTHMTLKLQALHNDLSPIKKGIYWLVGLILTAVVMALLALVLKK